MTVMKASILAGVASFAFFAVDALKVEKRSDPSVLQLDLIKRTPTFSKRSLSARTGEVSAPDINYQKSLLYLIPLQFGTPPQNQLVQLDTGSSDLFVETDSSTLCGAGSPYNPTPCANFGSYDANSSSTYQYIDSNFIVSYGGGDGGTGDWAYDVVTIGGATVTDTQFGIQYKGDVLEGILGVSYPILETWSTFNSNPPYPNFPTLLVEQGFIALRAFSLWTNDDQSTGGTLLFGGIDTDKFTGELVTIDLLPSGFDGFTDVVDFTVSLLGVTGTDTTGNTVTFTNGATAQNVLLDSGTTITGLDPTLVQSIWDFVGATPYYNLPTSAYIDCSLSSSTETVNFAFQGITIKVPLSQLVIPQDNTGTNCQFGIDKAGGAGLIIGDTVLAAMYVVYDLDNNQVSLAPTVFNATTSNILQITAGPGGVPDSTSASSSVSSGSTSSTSTVSSTSSSSSSSSFTSTTSSSSSSSSSVSSALTTSTSSSKTSSTTASSSNSSKTTSTSLSTSTKTTSSSSLSTSQTTSTSSSKSTSSTKSTSTSSSSSKTTSTSSKTTSTSSLKIISTSRKTTSTSSKTTSTSTSKTTSTSSTHSTTLKTTTSTSTHSTTLKTSTTSSTSSTHSTQPTGPVSPVPGYHYLGCYTDNLNNRALTGIEFANIGNHQVDNTNCIEYCQSNGGYILAGTEYGGQCFCGNSFNPVSGSILVANSMCTMPCEGNSTQICGDSVRLSVWQKN